MFQKSSPLPSQAYVPNQPPWPTIFVAMPTFPFLHTQSNNNLLPFNNTTVDNNVNNTASDVGADFRPQLVTTIKPKQETTTEKKDIPIEVDRNYRLPINITDESKTKVIGLTLNETLKISQSNTSHILTKSTAVSKTYVSSIDTTNKLHNEVIDKNNNNDLQISKPKTDEAAPNMNNTFMTGNVTEKWLPNTITANKAKERAVEFLDNILHRIPRPTENKSTTKAIDDNKYSKVNQQGMRAVGGKENDIANVMQKIKSTAAQLRIISKAMESDTEALKKRKENISIVLHPKESTINKNNNHEEIVDIYEKIPSVSRDEHVTKKVNYSKLELNEPNLLPILYSELDNQKLSLSERNNYKKEKTAGSITKVSAINTKQTSKNLLHADIKPVETERNFIKHTPIHDVHTKFIEAERPKKKGAARRKKNKNKIPEVTFSSFIPIFKPKGRHNKRKNGANERHSVSNNDVNIDVNLLDIPNRESPQNMHKVNKENVQNINFNAQNLIPNSKMLPSDPINNIALNNGQNQNMEFQNQVVNSSNGKKLVMFKPETVSLCNVYEDLLEKVTMTVLVPYHVYKLANS